MMVNPSLLGKKMIETQAVALKECIVAMFPSPATSIPEVEDWLNKDLEVLG